MAAVRRSSDSGIIVALVIFIILTVVGLGGAIWSYQQLRIVQQELATTQADFEKAVKPVFNANSWDLSAQSPSEHGVRYVRESFADVAAKLEEAAEYEKVVKPKLGWESLDGMQESMTQYAIQAEATEQGDVPYATLRLLLERYDTSYRELSRRVADLTASQKQAAQKLADTQKAMKESEESLRAANSANLTDFQTKLGELRKANTDLEMRVEQHRQEAISWQQKHQQEVNARRTEVTQAEATANMWKKRYERAVAPPGEIERLVADGTILESQPEHDFVIIEGGDDYGRKADETFIVFSVNPDGSNKRKGTILVGQVKDHTSVATVMEEKGGYVLVGDKFASVLHWNEFHRYLDAADD